MGPVETLIEQFGLNSTILTMAAVFLLCLLVTRALMVNDLSKRLVERDERTAGREEHIVNIGKELIELKVKLQEKLNIIYAESNQLMSENKLKAQDQQKKIMAESRLQAQKIIQDSEAQNQKNLSAELEKIKEEIPKIADAIVSTLSNTSTQPSRTGELTGRV